MPTQVKLDICALCGHADDVAALVPCTVRGMPARACERCYKRLKPYLWKLN